VRVIFFIFLASAILESVTPETLAVKQVVLIPPKVYVGDYVEVLIFLADTQASIGVGVETPPKISWGQIEAFEAVEQNREKEVRIGLRAYAPGSHFLPEIKFKDHRISPIAIHIASLYDDGHKKIFPAKGPIRLPGTRFYIAVAIALFLALPLFVVWMAFSGRKRISSFVQGYQVKKPFRQYMRELKTLQQNLSIMNGREFYIELLNLLRGYFTFRIDATCFSSTSKEVDAILKRGVNNPDLVDLALEIFYFGDKVKFGHFDASIANRKIHSKNVEKVLLGLEKGNIEK
jgi:hypothetical protein